MKTHRYASTGLMLLVAVCAALVCLECQSGVADPDDSRHLRIFLREPRESYVFGDTIKVGLDIDEAIGCVVLELMWDSAGEMALIYPDEWCMEGFCSPELTVLISADEKAACMPRAHLGGSLAGKKLVLKAVDFTNGTKSGYADTLDTPFRIEAVR